MTETELEKINELLNLTRANLIEAGLWGKLKRIWIAVRLHINGSRSEVYDWSFLHLITRHYDDSALVAQRFLRFLRFSAYAFYSGYRPSNAILLACCWTADSDIGKDAKGELPDLIRSLANLSRAT